MRATKMKSQRPSRIKVGVVAFTMSAIVVLSVTAASNRHHGPTLPPELAGVARTAAWGSDEPEAMAGSAQTPQSRSFVSEFALYGDPDDPSLIIGKYTVKDDPTNGSPDGMKITERVLALDLATTSQTRSTYRWTDPTAPAVDRQLSPGDPLIRNDHDGSCYASHLDGPTTLYVVAPTCDIHAVETAMKELGAVGW